RVRIVERRREITFLVRVEFDEAIRRAHELLARYLRRRFEFLFTRNLGIDRDCEAIATAVLDRDERDESHRDDFREEPLPEDALLFVGGSLQPVDRGVFVLNGKIDE